MNLPEGMTESEVAKIIYIVVNRLAQRFRFGYHDIDDMKQQGCLFAIEALERYDNQRPLENFLWTHVHNRLYNYKRDNYERIQLPCFRCDSFESGVCQQYNHMLDCNLYYKCNRKNSAKKNIMNTLEFGQVQTEHEDSMSIDNNPHNNLENKELYDTIDKNIPILLRADYIRIKDGIKIPKARYDKIQEAIRIILIENGYLKE